MAWLWHDVSFCPIHNFHFFFPWKIITIQKTCLFLWKFLPKKLKEKWISFLCIQRPRVSFINVCIFKPFLKRSTSLFNEHKKNDKLIKCTNTKKLIPSYHNCLNEFWVKTRLVFCPWPDHQEYYFRISKPSRITKWCSKSLE